MKNIDDIKTAATLMITRPELTEEELVSLIAPQIEDRTEDAWLLVELLPIAFGRILVDRCGVHSSDSYMRMLDSGECSRPIPLASLPYWQNALAYARLQESIPIPKDDFFAIASRSAEVDTLNKMFESGVSPQGAVSSPIVFMRKLPKSASFTSKAPWWQFWK